MKKLISLLITGIMIVSGTTMIFAEEKNSNEITINAEKRCEEGVDKLVSENLIVPRSLVCPACPKGGRFMLVKTSKGREVLDSSPRCDSKPFGSDYIYKTLVTKSYKCEICAYGLNVIEYITRKDCRGTYS